MQAGVSPFRRFMLYWLCVVIIMFLCMQYFLNVPIKIIIITITQDCVLVRIVGLCIS